jgi:hypothetical protein
VLNKLGSIDSSGQPRPTCVQQCCLPPRYVRESPKHDQTYTTAQPCTPPATCIGHVAAQGSEAADCADARWIDCRVPCPLDMQEGRGDCLQQVVGHENNTKQHTASRHVMLTNRFLANPAIWPTQQFGLSLAAVPRILCVNTKPRMQA